MNMKNRLALSLILTVLAILGIATSALAVPGVVYNIYSNPSDTSITLTWAKAAGATSTMVRYKTSAYPTTTADGTLVYNGTSNQVILTGLTAGGRYYFSFWGFDGAYGAVTNYGPVSTLAQAIPSGGNSTAGNNSNLPSLPSLPADINQAPAVPALQLQPFTTIIDYFTTQGLGMPAANAWEWLAIAAIVGAGVMLFVWSRNFLVAWGVSFVLTWVFASMILVQWWLIPIEIMIALGVWAVDRYFQ
jgi:hypothetical protein